jgi:hypothetical protein
VQALQYTTRERAFFALMSPRVSQAWSRILREPARMSVAAATYAKSPPCSGEGVGRCRKPHQRDANAGAALMWRKPIENC